MLSLLLSTALETPVIDHATDWNTTAWIIWWALTGAALAMYLVGANSISAYSSRIPSGIGFVMAIAGYIFLFVALAQMLRHSAEGKNVLLIVVVFLVIAGVTGIAGAMAAGGQPRLGWIAVGLLGAWTVYGGLSELVTRVGLATGIAPLGILGLLVAGCLIFFSQRR